MGPYIPAIHQDLIHALRKILLDVPFPESEHEPSELRQLVIDILVTLHISCKMALPVFLVRCDLLPRMFLMAACMPEITINENRGFSHNCG